MKKFKILNNVGESKHFFPAFLFLFLSVFNFYSVEAQNLPDFAFPETVDRNARSSLNEALSLRDDTKALRAMMNMIIANNLIGDSEALRKDLNLIDSVVPFLSTNSKRVAFLIEAEILSQEYLDNISLYEGRSLPLESSWPSDPTEWSGEMYKEKILSLIQESTEGMWQEKEEGIAKFSSLLTDVAAGEKIGITIQDFLSFKSEGILKNYLKEDNYTVIPFYPQESEQSIEGRFKEESKKILNGVINAEGKERSVIKALAFYDYSGLLKQPDRLAYLLNSLRKLEGEEGAGYLLYQIWSNYSTSQVEYKKEMAGWLEKYPDGCYHEKVRYALSQMSEENISLEFPNKVVPGDTLKGKVTLRNLSEGYVLLYRLSDSQISPYGEVIAKKIKGKPFRSIKVGIEEKEANDDGQRSKEIEIPGLLPGMYVAIPSLSGNLPPDWNKNYRNFNLSTFRVSGITLLSSFETNIKDSGKVYVVDSKDMQPIEGAVVNYYKDASKGAKGKLVTNNQGFVSLPDGFYRIEARYGESKATLEAGFHYFPEQPRVSHNISLFTDLSVYRPGDTVRFMAVGWKQDKIKNSLMSDTEITVELRDVNYISVGEKNLFLNKDGRSTDYFVIPRDRLLGTYRLKANYSSFPNEFGGECSIEVEEYKTPPFQVTLEQEESRNPEIIIFSGKAMTYSGLPITDAKVDIKVDFIPYRWFFNSVNASFHTDTITNKEGSFSISLPLQNLKGTLFENGRYRIHAEVTSNTGESEKSFPLNFYISENYNIRFNVPEKIEVKGDSVKFTAIVNDPAGLPQQVKLRYRIKNLFSDSKELEGDFISPNLFINSKELPSGKYKLEFKLPGDSVWTSGETVIWRADDKKVPYPTPLWLPVTEYVYQNTDTSIDVKLGNFYSGWLLYYISDGHKLLESGWISPREGMHVLKVEIPEGKPEIFVNLAGLHDFESVNSTVNIIPAKNLEKLKIETITFRDNISAGNRETWKFLFKTGDIPASNVNAMSVMTDKALNSIKEFKWNFNIFNPSSYNKINLRIPSIFTGVSFGRFSPLPVYPKNIDLVPEWQTYGYPWLPLNGIKAGGILYRSMAVKNMVTTESAIMIEETAADYSIEDSVQESPNLAEEEEPVNFRPAEMPVAFFKPEMKTDNTGVLSLDFIVPDFNTTWQLQIAGYNNELLTDVATFDAVASKPVIVKIALPRFLRTGDKAQISATIYNNSDEEMAIEGNIEISDPSSGRVIGSCHLEKMNLSPSGNKVMTCSLTVPEDVCLLAVKAFGKGENHKDGEQGFVTVLPSSTPVTDAITFYATSTEERIQIKIPKLKKNANVTLKYCDNPLWEVLTSLPALTSSNGEGALSLAQWLFGTVTAFNIIQNNQSIEESLRRLMETGDSTARLSGLNKDSELKISSIQTTPWVNNQERADLRIGSLGKYLDYDATSRNIDLKIEALLKLQNADGGWSWFEGMKSSPYITREILEVLGRLKSNGMLPASLESSVIKGIRYSDQNLESQRKESGKLEVISTMNYLLCRREFNIPVSKQLKQIEKECEDSIKNQWRYWNIADKTAAGLYLLKQDPEESSVIASSLKEFMEKRESIYVRGLMLELFEKFNDCKEAKENLTQKILLAKETQEWGEDYRSAGVINSLLKVIPDFEINRKPPVIIINGKEIPIREEDYFGSLTLNLNPVTDSGKQLVIIRETGVPGWGGILSQYLSPIKEVKKEKVENLSIEKKIYKISGGKTVEAKDLKRGDKVRISLTVKIGKDMDYLVLKDGRGANLQTEDKNSGLIFMEGIPTYKETGISATSFFIEHLPAGNYIFSYDCNVERAGDYSIGIAEIQSLYSPTQVAHSAGRVMEVND
ncbi:MAG: hypothetical protein J1F12_05360 [Muribaculaceae bacterium]|nr:hypothetical protein [Muribaculaceae bacterium]